MDVELNFMFLVAKDAYSQEEIEENVMALSKDYMKGEAVIFLLQHRRQGGREGCVFLQMSCSSSQNMTQTNQTTLHPGVCRSAVCSPSDLSFLTHFSICIIHFFYTAPDFFPQLFSQQLHPQHKIVCLRDARISV